MSETITTTATGTATIEWTHTYDQRIPGGVTLRIVPDDPASPPLDLFANTVQEAAVPAVCAATSTDLPDTFTTDDED